jgi:glycosyltransferase involved in cell wall biosynthesis/SAM-dependent methyltransferase
MPSAPLWLLDHADIMGGGQLFALRLARFVRADQPERELVIVCPRDSELAARSEAEGIETRHAEFPALVPSPGLVAGVRALRRLLDQVPDGALVVGNTARVQAYAAAAWPFVRRGPRFVHLMHEQESAARPSARFVYRRFGALAVVGGNAQRAYRERLPGVEVQGLNNFLAPAELSALVASRAERPPAERPVLGVLARLIPEKGVLELVEELAAVGDSWSELRVAGERQDAAYVAWIERRAEHLGLSERVHLLGHVDDVAGFLREVDVVVLPSTGNEAQPTVILEAVASGRAVVVRRPVWSPDFTGLPIAPYEDARDLPTALAAARPDPGASELIASRFGPGQVLAALDAAAAEAGGSLAAPMPSALARSRSGPLPLTSAPQRREYEAIADRIARDESGQVLDWGCGYGQLSDMMLRRGVSVTSHEYREGQEDVTVETLPCFPHISAHVTGDPVALPFETDSFDAVLSCGVLEHVAEPELSLEELHRVLKPGGTLYVYKLPNRRSYLEAIARRIGLYYHGQLPNDRVYVLDTARSLLEEHGYEIVELRLANMLPLTLEGRLATRLAPLIWHASRLLARVPGLNLFATNVELVARAGQSPSARR